MYPSLSRGAVYIYYTCTRQLAQDEKKTFTDVLSLEEMTRYNKMKSPERKTEFLFSRVLLKNVLACYMGTMPKKIIFSSGRHGKLQLEELPEIDFNLSHSKGIVACALALDHKVGIDVENKRRDVLEVARAFFNTDEIKYIDSYPDVEKNLIACKIWTMKEAYIKSTGEGLATPLESFNVTESTLGHFVFFTPTTDHYLSVFLDNKGDICPRVYIQQMDFFTCQGSNEI